MTNNLSDKLLNKSIEAFMLGLEIYNKPTIKYRVEGFSFFVCNSWELLLKAYLVDKKGEESIYYVDNPERTISLENCISKIFTNKNDPLRINLEKIVDLRNTSTHFITTDYEMIYAPLFQSCVLNYSNKVFEMFNFDITYVMPSNFLTLSVNLHPFDTNEIKAKYSPKIANKILKTKEVISELQKEKTSPAFSVSVIHEHYITKNAKRADGIFAIDKDSDGKLNILKVLKDPNNTHKYKTKGCIKEINKRIKKDKLNFISLSKNPSKKHTFNQFHFNLFTSYYAIKEKEALCYKYRMGEENNKTFSYSYSMTAINFIYDEIKKDPENIIQNLKDINKKS